jgi:hypothetical protein
MGALLFGLGSLLTLVIASGVSVYGAEHVEHAWGKGGAFQVLCLLSVAATFLLTFGYGLGAAISKRFPPNRKSVVLGSACAAAFLALLWLASEGQASAGQSLTIVLLLPFIGGVAPLFHERHHG